MNEPSSRARDPSEVAKFEALAPRFWDEDGEFRPLHRLNPVRFAYIAERASLSQARALDVGCGGGLLCEAMTRAGAEVTGIDLAESMIEVARLHAADSGLRIRYQVAEAESLRAEGRTFDVVTCMEMLEHVPEPSQIIATLAQLVRPGGDVVLSTLNRGLRSFLGAIVAAEYVLRLLPRGTHDYERFIRPSELAGWGRAVGLQLLDVRGIDYDPFARDARLTDAVAVNYLAHFRRPMAA